VNPDVTNSTPVHEHAVERQIGKSATATRGVLLEGVLREGEEVRAHGTCWALLRRERVRLLFQARRRYELVLTDKRLLLLARGKHQRRRLGLGPDGVALEHALELLHLERSRTGFPLLQLRVELPTGRTLVLEFDRVRRTLGRAVTAALAPAT